MASQLTRMVAAWQFLATSLNTTLKPRCRQEARQLRLLPSAQAPHLHNPLALNLALPRRVAHLGARMSGTPAGQLLTADFSTPQRRGVIGIHLGAAADQALCPAQARSRGGVGSARRARSRVAQLRAGVWAFSAALSAAHLAARVRGGGRVGVWGLAAAAEAEVAKGAGGRDAVEGLAARAAKVEGGAWGGLEPLVDAVDVENAEAGGAGPGGGA
eukprot:CAMPEP_0198370460 /NCGR_PEP_ID=MMETSP1450-20131203/156729_1 /TAXON_ID=753684 ORGANISM="Madagascaria erythrocladiodes, Strain CCMP3234" /NCGR_SAMPLE_ID=MMETSP1450 /ASSEMBLY_ACC=CAM_ASM_001115 /LENGTH=214 /DNA_ID=CAMNT_0044078001 /DNA_START=1988 /DNA_END=2629 /DNA_ORIENTATION=-